MAFINDIKVSEKSNPSLNFRGQNQFKQSVGIASICHRNFILRESKLYGPAYVLYFSKISFWVIVA